jgi:putative lipoic acid-binding regulatory protein
MTTKSEEHVSLLEFPCRFPIKAMGRNSDDFEAVVTGIILAHAQLWPDQAVTVAPSTEGNFVSVTATIEAQSQQQLDDIYQDLTDSEQVMMAL